MNPTLFGTKIENLTLALIQSEKQPKLYFHRDVQVDYGIDRDRTILNLYQQHNLQTHVGLNHFMQESENYDSWWVDYHEYQKRSLY